MIEIDKDPSAKKIREFGWGLFVFGALLAGLSWWRGRHAEAFVVLPVCAVLGVLTLASARAGKAIYRGWTAVASVIGGVVSVAAMAVAYYLVLTPVALLLRATGRDALRLRRPSEGSCWGPLSVPDEKSYFERLF